RLTTLNSTSASRRLMRTSRRASSMTSSVSSATPVSRCLAARKPLERVSSIGGSTPWPQRGEGVPIPHSDWLSRGRPRPHVQKQVSANSGNAEVGRFVCAPLAWDPGHTLPPVPRARGGVGMLVRRARLRSLVVLFAVGCDGGAADPDAPLAERHQALEGACEAGRDDDHDGLAGCADPDCASAPACRDGLACTSPAYDLSSGDLRRIETAAWPLGVSMVKATTRSFNAGGYHAREARVYAIDGAANHL